MNVFTVSLFGHRTIDDLRRIDERLIPILREVIRKAPMKYAEQKKKRVINLNDDFSADFF